MAKWEEILSKCCRPDIRERHHSTDVATENSVWGPDPKMRGSGRSRRAVTGTNGFTPLPEM